VRTQQYRLDQQGTLYDLIADPGQERDVPDQHPELTRQLREEVEQWKQDVLAELETDDRPFPVGHPDFRYTQLPARDATVAGGIQRSNRFPNCSYFTNWTSTDDAISWDVEVLADG